MKIAVIFSIGLLAAALAVQAFARLTPLDPARWHRPPPESETGDWESPRGFATTVRLDDGPAAVLDRIDGVALAWPRTRRLAGASGDGMITYVTRTAFWGFPDVTTVSAVPDGAGSRVTLRARAALAGYDWGMNRARVRAWLAALGA